MLIVFVMRFAWQAAAETFEQSLRMYSVRPSAVTDVETAWRAFADFVQTEIAEVAPADEDGDGFIVQWGRRSWGDNRLVLTLTRQLAVGDPDGLGREHKLWHVELGIAFDDDPELIVLEPGLDASDTGFRFEPIGPLRAAALAEVRGQAQEQALVRAMWTATPIGSELTFERVC